MIFLDTASTIHTPRTSSHFSYALRASPALFRTRILNREHKWQHLCFLLRWHCNLTLCTVSCSRRIINSNWVGAEQYSCSAAFALRTAGAARAARQAAVTAMGARASGLPVGWLWPTRFLARVCARVSVRVRACVRGRARVLACICVHPALLTAAADTSAASATSRVPPPVPPPCPYPCTCKCTWSVRTRVSTCVRVHPSCNGGLRGL